MSADLLAFCTCSILLQFKLQLLHLRLGFSALLIEMFVGNVSQTRGYNAVC